MRLVPFIVLFLTACTGGSANETGDTGVGTDTTLTFESFINATSPIIGDATCYAPGDPWLTQSVDPSLQGLQTVGGLVEDFESERFVPSAKVEIWDSNDVSGPRAREAVSEQINGTLSLEVNTCTMTAYKVSTPPELDETKNTWKVNNVYELDSTGTATSPAWTSVSLSTYRVIPSLLGLSPDPARSLIAGTAYGCDGVAIEGAQVIVKDESGAVIQGVFVKYFEEEFPVRDRVTTSADGLWIAVDVPVGQVTVELYAVLTEGSAPELIGATKLQSYPDSINISNIYTGFGDGQKYPESCLLAQGS